MNKFKNNDIILSGRGNEITYYILNQSQDSSDPIYNVIEFFPLSGNEITIKKLEIRYSWFEKNGYYITSGMEISMNQQQLIKDCFEKEVIIIND